MRRGLVLFLYGADNLGNRTGLGALGALIVSIVLLAAFFSTAAKKGDRALIDLRLFKGKTFSASVITQFMANGITFAGHFDETLRHSQGVGRWRASILRHLSCFALCALFCVQPQ